MDAHTGCLCRVPINESAAPKFSTRHQLAEWARDEGVEILPDHLGRLSISMADAYRLYAEQQAVTNAHARAEAERKAAQERRWRVHAETYGQAVAAGKSDAEASAMAWTAVHRAEQGRPA